MLRKAAFSFVAAALLLSAAQAEPHSVVALEKAMSCTHMLHPRLLLRALQRDGVIRRKASEYADGAPTFAIVKPFRLNGFEAKYVSGWDSDYRGHLFEREPGTAPPKYVSVILKGQEQAVQKRFGILDRFKNTSPDSDEDWGDVRRWWRPLFRPRSWFDRAHLQHKSLGSDHLTEPSAAIAAWTLGRAAILSNQAASAGDSVMCIFLAQVSITKK
jgi:hypothetical protein